MSGFSFLIAKIRLKSLSNHVFVDPSFARSYKYKQKIMLLFASHIIHVFYNTIVNNCVRRAENTQFFFFFCTPPRLRTRYNSKVGNQRTREKNPLALTAIHAHVVLVPTAEGVKKIFFLKVYRYGCVGLFSLTDSRRDMYSVRDLWRI